MTRTKSGKTASAPRISIGLPVYNGERYLRLALDSLLQQSFDDLEVIISDNASTDGTQELCLEYASRDARVRYSRCPTNIGGTRNHNRVMELARGKYFAMAAHDDVRLPCCFERCLEVLEQDASIVVCFTRTTVIDGDGRVIGDRPFDLRMDAPEPSERFREIIRMDHQIEPCHGLTRVDTMRKIPLYGLYPDFDRVYFAELSLHGPFHKIDEELFHCREHVGQSTSVYPSRQERMAWIDPNRPNAVKYPHFRQFREYLHAIRRAPLDGQERRRCYRAMASWLHSNRARLGGDLYFVAYQRLRRIYRAILGRS